MQKWYYCPHCGNKLTKYDPLIAICSGVYIKCRLCKEIVEIKCVPKYRKPCNDDKKP